MKQWNSDSKGWGCSYKLQQQVILSVQVGRLVVAARLSDVCFVCTGEFIFLSPQKVAQILSGLIFCGRLPRQNYFCCRAKRAEQILQCTRSELSLRHLPRQKFSTAHEANCLCGICHDILLQLVVQCVPVFILSWK